MSDVFDGENLKRIIYLLTEVHFLSNDYKNHPNSATLQCGDSISVKDVTESECTFSVSRKIESPKKDFISFFVSYDVIFVLKHQCSDMLSMTETDLINHVINKQKGAIENCTARISLIVSQLSAQIANGVPMITPPSLISDN